MSMQRHMKRHDPKILPFGCKKCVKRFEDEAKLENHELHGHLGSEKESKEVLQCDFCGATGSSEVGMENHMLDDHLRLEKDKEENSGKTREKSKVSFWEKLNKNYLNYFENF